MGKRSFRFGRVGGFDQALLTSGADLAAIGDLDQKLWVALACPVGGLELDQRTLALIDTDADGRIRAPELIAATRWTCRLLKDAETLVEGSGTLALASIDDSTEDGKLLLGTAQEMLKSLGKAGATSIDVPGVAAALEAFHRQPFNGDGILPAASATDDTVKKAIEDVLACSTPATDVGGEPGVTKATVEGFFEQVAAHAAWLAKAGSDPAIVPLGAETAAAWNAFSAVRDKVTDYFARVSLATYDGRALPALNGDEKGYAAMAVRVLTAGAAEIADLPLAQIQPGKPLQLDEGLNPAWASRMAELRAKVLVPLLGARSVLSEQDWGTVCGKLAAHAAWRADVAGASVAKLGAARVEELAASDLRKKILALVEQDAAKEPMAKALENVERLVRYHRDLMTIANNFVSFRDFYARDRDKAIFQAGTLYVDNRSCDLCLRVADAAKHATMAPLANTYLLYCDCKNAKGDKMSICAAVTAGDVDNLMVGRNGIFYDRKGGDWDATITKIVENPISVRQAFWAPYKKVIRMVEEYIARRAAAAQASSDARLTAGVEHTTTAVETGQVPGAQEPPKPAKLDIGVVAAIGVAVGGITAALGAFLDALFGLGYLMPLGVLGLVLAISGPSMAVAWLKLRKRTLGPILDANGWAVNAQAKVNVPLGGSLTSVSKLPEGASRDLTDPFEEKRRPWWLYITLAMLLLLAGAWLLGKLDRFLPEKARSTHVLGASAPAQPLAPPGPTRDAGP